MEELQNKDKNMRMDIFLKAVALMDNLVLSDLFEEFLTLPAYDVLISLKSPKL